MIFGSLYGLWTMGLWTLKKAMGEMSRGSAFDLFSEYWKNCKWEIKEKGRECLSAVLDEIRRFLIYCRDLAYGLVLTICQFQKQGQKKYIFDHFAQPHFELFVSLGWALLRHMCDLAHCITLLPLPLPHSCKCSSYLLHIKFIFKRNICMNRQFYLFICVLQVIWHSHIFLLRIHSTVDQFISKPANFNLEIQISRAGTN